jgi:hypothetical protein
MILNISETIAGELRAKTLLAERLGRRVEEAYDSYHGDTEQIGESVNFVYYDAKSPKTFCTDVAEEEPLAAATMTTTTTRQVKAGRGRERRFDVYEEDGYFCFYFIFCNSGWCK